MFIPTYSNVASIAKMSMKVHILILKLSLEESQGINREITVHELADISPCLLCFALSILEIELRCIDK